MKDKITIEDLGYDAYFASNRTKLGLESFSVARVAAEYRGAYKVINEHGQYLARVTGKQMFTASSRTDYPAVGDWVSITDLDGEHATIHSVLPRKTLIKRSSGDKTRTSGKKDLQIVATNIDVAFIVESVDRDFNLNRLERYVVIADDGGVKPVIVLNKIDLISKEVLDSILMAIKNRFQEIKIIPTSFVNDQGMPELNEYIEKGKTYCFLGSSGVGKSSLINKLLGRDAIKTKSIGHGTGRGRHTTTTREMYILENDGIVIDNPGMREVGMADIGAGIDGFFDEITALAAGCKFVDCTHVHEPDCEVLMALNSGKLDVEKYSNYINLKKECQYFETTELEKREKDRDFGKFIKTAKKQLKERKG